MRPEGPNGEAVRGRRTKALPLMRLDTHSRTVSVRHARDMRRTWVSGRARPNLSESVLDS